MKALSRTLATTAAALAVTGTLGAIASAAAADQPAGHVVFVQNDDPSGNAVIAYDRAADGTLTQAGIYPTGGLGGVLNGSVVDHLASQGGLALDAAHQLLFAVNAGSDTISVFTVHGSGLRLAQTLPAGGSFPASVAVSGNLAYVLDARNGGAVSGFRIDHQHVQPINGSTRALGLDAQATPEFTHTPGQVTFTPDGAHLVVTTKANGNDVDVFGVRPDGRLGAPTVNALPGTVPFAATFDAAGHLVLAEAGTNAVATFSVDSAGSLTQLDYVATGQAATCWIIGANDYFYVSNAGSGSLSELSASSGGALSSLGQAATDAGTVDATVSSDGQFVYAQAGKAGIVDEYRVQPDGTLTQIGSVTVPDAAGGEGIVAS